MHQNGELRYSGKVYLFNKKLYPTTRHSKTANYILRQALAKSPIMDRVSPYADDYILFRTTYGAKHNFTLSEMMSLADSVIAKEVEKYADSLSKPCGAEEEPNEGYVRMPSGVQVPEDFSQRVKKMLVDKEVPEYGWFEGFNIGLPSLYKLRAIDKVPSEDLRPIEAIIIANSLGLNKQLEQEFGVHVFGEWVILSERNNSNTPLNPKNEIEARLIQLLNDVYDVSRLQEDDCPFSTDYFVDLLRKATKAYMDNEEITKLHILAAHNLYYPHLENRIVVAYSICKSSLADKIELAELTGMEVEDLLEMKPKQAHEILDANGFNVPCYSWSAKVDYEPYLIPSIIPEYFIGLI